MTLLPFKPQIPVKFHQLSSYIMSFIEGCFNERIQLRVSVVFSCFVSLFSSYQSSSIVKAFHDLYRPVTLQNVPNMGFSYYSSWYSALAGISQKWCRLCFHCVLSVALNALNVNLSFIDNTLISVRQVLLAFSTIKLIFSLCYKYLRGRYFTTMYI